jgi:hypothetical protein
MKHSVPELIFIALFAAGIFFAVWRTTYGLMANVGWALSVSRGTQPRTPRLALKNLIRTGAACRPEEYFSPRQMRTIRLVAVGVGSLASAAFILLIAWVA